MCGIIAISSPVDRNISLKSSILEIHHRGPDDSGEYISSAGDCSLGQVRLSILDLSVAGHQPMADKSGRFVITYNGEVYNYRNLKSSLVKKYGDIDWRSETDTEVIIEGFAREGITFLDKLNGIFSLVIYDKQQRKMYVLRDPIGIKPLFVTTQNGVVYFCSELKGLLAIQDLNRTLRHKSLADQISFMYVPEPYTMYKEFNKVQPGVCFTYQYGSLISSVPLFSHLVPVDTALSNENEAIEMLQETFSTAVQRQLVSDVPVSLFLSGGLDSSAIAISLPNSPAQQKVLDTSRLT